MKKREKTQWENPDRKTNTMYNGPATYEETLSALMASALLNYAYDKDYRLIKRMYNIMGITNEEIYNKGIISPFVKENDENDFFYDLIAVIHDKSREDDGVLSTFNEVLHSVFPNPTLSSKIPALLREYARLYADKTLFEKNTSSYSVLVSDIRHRYLARPNAKLQAVIDAHATFNTGEPIFEDPLFRKYIGRRLEELAAYCCKFYKRDDVTIDNIYDVLLEGMRSHSAQDEEPLHDKCVRTTYFQVYAGINNMVRRTLYRLGGPQLISITHTQSINEGKAYLPDMEALVTDFFKEYVRIRCCRHVTDHWDYSQDKGVSISKLYLSRECIPDPAYVHSSIQFLFNIELLNHVYNEQRKKYYLNFSWEKQNYIASEQALKDDLSEMRRMLSDVQSRLDSANEKVLFYKAQAEVSRTTQNSPVILARTESLFEKKLDQKDEEIARLRKELALKDAYIELISQPDEEIATTSYDKDVVTAHKYLFVGRWQEAYPGLKKAFPNSVFLDSPAKDISADVDAVVFLIKYMSHALFYKVQNAAALNDVPRVYCNNRNINNIYANIYEKLKKSGE